MTHEPEKTFGEKVREYLVEEYGEENVRGNVYLSDMVRYADFIVDAGLVTLSIEVENDFEAVVKGVGQSIMYSEIEENAVPVVIVPEGHVDYPEVTSLRKRVTIVELDL